MSKELKVVYGLERGLNPAMEYDIAQALKKHGYGLLSIHTNQVVAGQADMNFVHGNQDPIVLKAPGVAEAPKEKAKPKSTVRPSKEIVSKPKPKGKGKGKKK
jgi:hypothetical protein